jgi:transcriptional regulator with XRE-family HTH domain
LTERGLARRAGISQPHLHNVLKGKRFFSLQTADLVLHELGLSVVDLIESGKDASARVP